MNKKRTKVAVLSALIILIVLAVLVAIYAGYRIGIFAKEAIHLRNIRLAVIDKDGKLTIYNHDEEQDYTYKLIKYM